MDTTRTVTTSIMRTATTAAVATAAATVVCSAIETGTPAAAVNAISHIFWGDTAAGQDDVSAKYTANRVLLNSAAMLPRVRRGLPRGAGAGLAVLNSGSLQRGSRWAISRTL